MGGLRWIDVLPLSFYQYYLRVYPLSQPWPIWAATLFTVKYIFERLVLSMLPKLDEIVQMAYHALSAAILSDERPLILLCDFYFRPKTRSCLAYRHSAG